MSNVGFLSSGNGRDSGIAGWENMGTGFKFQDRNGMGMGMKSLKWEGIGTKNLFPHTSSSDLNLVVPRTTGSGSASLVCTRDTRGSLGRRSDHPDMLVVHQCLNGRAPPYLSEHCIPVSSADKRRHLRSANRHLLAVPRFRLNTYGRRAFSVAGPMAWNSLPDFIWDPTSSTDCFRRLLKT